MPGKTALLVVDAQEEVVIREPYLEKTVFPNIKALIDAFRSGGLLVIYTKDMEVPAGAYKEVYPSASPRQIHHLISPKGGDIIIEKHHSSAFNGTNIDLDEELKRRRHGQSSGLRLLGQPLRIGHRS